MIQPTQTTTYILTASNATTLKTAPAIITVKPIQQIPSQQTLNITCKIDNASNTIIIASVDANVKWSDIAITSNTNAT